MSKKMTEKNTKQEILDALRDAQDRIDTQRNNSVNFENDAKEAKKAEVIYKVEEAKSFTYEPMIKILKSQFETIEEALKTYEDVKEAIEIKRSELAEILGVGTESFSLAAIVNAQNDLKASVEKEITEKRMVSMEEFKVAKEEVKKMQDDAKQQNAQAEKEIKARRTREEEEWRYKFDRTKVIEKNTFLDEMVAEKRNREAEWKETESNHIERDRSLNAREIIIKQNEDLLENLKSQVAEFPAKLSEAIALASDEGKKKADQAFGYEKSLLMKDCERQIEVLETKNETLNNQLSDAIIRIASISQKLDESYTRIQDMASKSVDGANSKELVSTLRSALNEKTGTVKA